MGTLASQAEIVSGSASLGGGGLGELPPDKKIEIVYAKSYNVVHFGWKMVRNAVYNAFLNTLTMGTLFPCVPAAIIVVVAVVVVVDFYSASCSASNALINHLCCKKMSFQRRS